MSVVKYDEIGELRKRIKTLETRNKRVGADKAWETSWTRRIAIALLTYGLLALYFGFILRIDPWLNALVPTTGFVLSTLTISSIKQRWLRTR